MGPLHSCAYRRIAGILGGRQAILARLRGQAKIAEVGERRTNWLVSWRERHRSPVSFWLHMAGIPLTILAVVLGGYQLIAGRWDLWWRPAALLGVGYFAQYLGHLHEGNEMGEIILIKRLLRRSYVAVSPRYRKP